MRPLLLLAPFALAVLAAGCSGGERPPPADPAPANEALATEAAPLPALGCADGPPATVSGARAAFDFTTRATTPSVPCAMGRDYDVQVHSRDAASRRQLEPMEAHHGPDCAGYPATHPVSSRAGAVFVCNNHLMTAINGSDYGVIYVTPRAMVNFGEGEAVIRWDISTLRTSDRDWWDVWLTPWDDNLALPLERDLPDLTGEPFNAVHLRLATENAICPEVFINGVAQLPGRFQPGDWCAWWKGYDQVLEPSAVGRTTFELRIARNHLAIGLPGAGLWWYDADLPVMLPFEEAVVQFGHHSYNPGKGGGTPNTWHWDNLSIAPAVPFSIEVTSPETVVTAGTNSLGRPAPPGAALRFAANGSIVEIEDGRGWRTVTPQRAGDGFRSASYFVAIPEGTTTVQVRMSAGESWYRGPFVAGDFATWSRLTNDR